MDKIISLLTNLFSLSKIASVTLPGLALAGVVAFFFKEPHPIDTIPIAISSIATASEIPPAQEPCPEFSNLSGGSSKKDCKKSSEKQVNTLLSPACRIVYLDLSVLNTVDDLAKLENAQGEYQKAADDLHAAEGRLKVSEQNKAANDLRATQNKLTDPKQQKADEDAIVRNKQEVESKSSVYQEYYRTLRAFTTLSNFEILQNFAVFEKVEGRYVQDSKVLKQLVLEEAKDRLTTCGEIESSRRGQEETDNEQLAADITALDKQRVDIQETYTAYLKGNNRTLAENYRDKLVKIMTQVDQERGRLRLNLLSIRERDRRAAEIKRDIGIIDERLGEPGRVRPIQEFDIYVQGLINHIIGIILLSMVLSLVLNAIGRATYIGFAFDELFDGF